jgi:hypothetical protein
MPDIDALTIEIAKLELGPHDVLVLKVPDTMSEYAERRLCYRIITVCGDVRLLVLPTSTDLATIKPGDLDMTTSPPEPEGTPEPDSDDPTKDDAPRERQPLRRAVPPGA